MRSAVKQICSSLVLVLATVLLGAGPPAREEAPAKEGPLEYAFRFASAIKSDEKDMAKMQQAVVLDYAHVGALDAAIERAGSVVGWRGGIVYAELARQLALQGRAEEARVLIEKAETLAKGVQGWENPRIHSHIARALAVLGEGEESRKIAEALASSDPVQYSGRSEATVASSVAAEGGFDEAMKRLETFKADSDVEQDWWRTMGYLDLARRKDHTEAQRGRAAAAARESANAIKGWRKADALMDIADEFRLLGKQADAREALEAAEVIVNQVPDTSPIKPRMIGEIGQAWSRLGDKERGGKALGVAMKVIPNALSIDQPGLYAELGSGYMVLGDEEKAWSVYDTAFASAESLVNARPRAIAVVQICRSMGRNGVDLKDETRGRLDAIYSGLREPW